MVVRFTSSRLCLAQMEDNETVLLGLLSALGVVLLTVLGLLLRNRKKPLDQQAPTVRSIDLSVKVSKKGRSHASRVKGKKLSPRKGSEELAPSLETKEPLLQEPAAPAKPVASVTDTIFEQSYYNSDFDQLDPYEYILAAREGRC